MTKNKNDLRRISSLNRHIESLSTLNQQAYKIISEYPGLLRDYDKTSPDRIRNAPKHIRSHTKTCAT